MRIPTKAAAVLAAALLSVPASAISCTVSATPVAFGGYNGVTKTQMTTTASFTLTCTGPGTLNYVITLSPGQSGTATARYMKSGLNRLNYQVYLDSGRTTVFGDGAGGTANVSGSATLSSSPASGSATLYPAIAAGQAAVPGSYTDALTVTVTY